MSWRRRASSVSPRLRAASAIVFPLVGSASFAEIECTFNSKIPVSLPGFRWGRPREAENPDARLWKRPNFQACGRPNIVRDRTALVLLNDNSTTLHKQATTGSRPCRFIGNGRIGEGHTMG